ncbi:hypothetical protein [Actinomadura rifamycini]|uniref:hypothetical protein n=1 Tax=Actinomadura rifamycini TaxID=31962 RepID=UPI0006881FCA|nr:hypothetical protein [Actinomadura rifamycini]
MFLVPDDPGVRKRMEDAFERAAERLGCAALPDAPGAWGHGGRTHGRPVEGPAGVAWLRVLAVPVERRGSKLWAGNEMAAAVLPRAVPRPRLLDAVEWIDGEVAHRAELSSYVAASVCSSAPALTDRIHLPGAWWVRLREALRAVAATPVPGARPPVVSQEYVARAIPRYLGETDVDTTVTRWSLAHGDLHWANLTAPELTVLDWEGFGPAPFGFDAAHLYAYSLPVPEVADGVRRTFADVLAAPDGRLAELTVAAMIVQAAERDPVHARLAPLVLAHLRGSRSVGGAEFDEQDSGGY